MGADKKNLCFKGLVFLNYKIEKNNLLISNNLVINSYEKVKEEK